jgi:hypothetical protein
VAERRGIGVLTLHMVLTPIGMRVMRFEFSSKPFPEHVVWIVEALVATMIVRKYLGWETWLAKRRSDSVEFVRRRQGMTCEYCIMHLVASLFAGDCSVPRSPNVFRDFRDRTAAG